MMVPVNSTTLIYEYIIFVVEKNVIKQNNCPKYCSKKLVSSSRRRW